MLRPISIVLTLVSVLVHADSGGAVAADPPPATPPAVEETRLPTDVQPRFESVELRLDPAQADYTGTVRIDLTVQRPTDAIRFHAQAMELRRVELEGKSGKVALAAGPDERGIVTAKAPASIAPGDYVLTIDFSNNFDITAASLYRLQTGGRWYAFTQFEAIDARKHSPAGTSPRSSSRGR